MCSAPGRLLAQRRQLQPEEACDLGVLSRSEAHERAS
jgi:hypothetical protein